MNDRRGWGGAERGIKWIIRTVLEFQVLQVRLPLMSKRFNTQPGWLIVLENIDTGGWSEVR